MRSALFVAVSGIILSVTAAGLAQSAGPGAMVGNLQVKEVGIADIDSSHLKVTVNLTLVPEQSATLKDIQLCAIRLNGLPAFADPLHQEVLLRKGVATSLPPVYLTVLFRDLNTVAPLRQMIEKQSVQVQGELVAAVQADFLQKLALHTQHPTVEFAIAQDVAVETGVTGFQRNIALSVLSVIEAGLAAKDAASQYIPGVVPAWVRDLEVKTKPNLFWVDSTYSLAEGKTVYPVTSGELGFVLQSGKLVAPSDVVEPWKYDAEFLGAMKSGAAKLVNQGLDIQLRRLSNSGTLLLSAGDFTVEISGAPEQEQVTPISFGLSQVQVLLRASPSALAVLTLRTPLPSGGLTTAPSAIAAQDRWDQVAVFRMQVDPGTGERRVETLQIGARREGNGIRLTQPVDAAVFGSPIMTPDGVIGLVQDEQSGAFLPQALLASPPLPGAKPE